MSGGGVGAEGGAAGGWGGGSGVGHPGGLRVVGVVVHLGAVKGRGGVGGDGGVVVGGAAGRVGGGAGEGAAGRLLAVLRGAAAPQRAAVTPRPNPAPNPGLPARGVLSPAPQPRPHVARPAPYPSPARRRPFRHQRVRLGAHDAVPVGLPLQLPAQLDVIRVLGLATALAHLPDAHPLVVDGGEDEDVEEEERAAHGHRDAQRVGQMLASALRFAGHWGVSGGQHPVLRRHALLRLVHGGGVVVIAATAALTTARADGPVAAALPGLAVVLVHGEGGRGRPVVAVGHGG